MKPVRGFPPIVDKHARVLILGSMPGEKSLAAGEYYAHPRNHFWSLMAELTGLDVSASYNEKIMALRQAGIAVWDVLQSCRRAGSLDSAIDKETLVANDFAGFFSAHPGIERVFFNGSAAEQIYRRHVLPGLENCPLIYTRLPSSSPANATYSYDRKLAAWREITHLL